MRNILWVYAKLNWAYDINVKTLASNLLQFNHHYFLTAKQTKNELLAIGNDMDIIVSMNPLNFYVYNKFDKVVSILDSVRAAEKVNGEIFAKVAGIICANSFLFKLAKTKNKNVILQPNGVNLDIYKPPVGLSTRKFTVGFAGDINGTYKADYKGWPFYQEAVNSLSDEVRQLNAIRGCNQILNDKMVSEFYHKIDCLVLATRNEGCSNVIAEALACGVPVLCTKVGYHGDDNQNKFGQCIYIERTAASIKTAILQLCKNELLHTYMKKVARDFACKNHDIKKVAKNYADFFKGIINE